MKKRFSLLLLITLLLVGFPVLAQDDAPPPQPGVSVTAYNEGTALVQDRRIFSLGEGMTLLDFTDVAAQIDPTSVTFSSLTDPRGTVVLEQNYVYDLVNSAALLNRYVDQVIELTADDGTVFRGVLLSGRSGDIILREDDGTVRVLSLSTVRDVHFPELPDGLITRPTLRWLISAQTGGEHLVELTYLTGGISWTADYNVLLAQDSQSLDLNGWITLNNTSGTSFQDAQLKLVAGDVNRVAPAPVARMDDMVVMESAAAGAPDFVDQREFFEYQLYEIARPVTIGDNETKQVEFVAGADIPATVFFVYDASMPFYNYGSPLTDQYYGETGITDVQNWLSFTTDEDGGVGADLPAGRIRVYQQDIDGAALLIGENRIDHTPQGEEVEIYLGNAFDLVGEHIQTNFQLISRNVLQESYEIHLRNRKDDKTVEIRVPEHMFRWSNWQILNSSHSYQQLDSNTIEFHVEVPPDGEVIITYTVQYSWP
ncbi:MAG: DUF4139 domain-containing protein [Chloroflexi bacterium]|nr:MAG: DUF4139 domain-containing protein [Chloroflexota bacterium]